MLGRADTLAGPLVVDMAVDARQVTLRYTDYRDANRHKTMRLAGAEFVRRFLQHILPKGLMRIRHFGFLANRCRQQKLAHIRRALAVAEAVAANCSEALGGETLGYPCPQCTAGRLHMIAQLPPVRQHWPRPAHRRQ